MVNFRVFLGLGFFLFTFVTQAQQLSGLVCKKVEYEYLNTENEVREMEVCAQIDSSNPNFDQLIIQYRRDQYRIFVSFQNVKQLRSSFFSFPGLIYSLIIDEFKTPGRKLCSAFGYNNYVGHNVAKHRKYVSIRDKFRVRDDWSMSDPIPVLAGWSTGGGLSEAQFKVNVLSVLKCSN